MIVNIKSTIQWNPLQ